MQPGPDCQLHIIQGTQSAKQIETVISARTEHKNITTASGPLRGFSHTRNQIVRFCIKQKEADFVFWLLGTVQNELAGGRRQQCGFAAAGRTEEQDMLDQVGFRQFDPMAGRLVTGPGNNG